MVSLKNRLADQEVSGFNGVGLSKLTMSLGYKDGNYPAESQVPVYTSSDVTASYAIKLRLKGELTLTGEDVYKRQGQRDIVIENMNCKSFSEAPLWSAMMTQILAKYQGEKHPAQIILLGQEAWAAYLSQRDEMQVKVPVMCSLASSNVVILPKDTVENLDCWMPESVDIFEDCLLYTS